MKQMVTVFPWPMHPEVAKVLEAIPNLRLEEAIPGGPGVVLAVGKVPPFPCDAILVKSPQRVAQAVDIITENGMKLITMADILGYKEIQPEKVEPKVRFR